MIHYEHDHVPHTYVLDGTKRSKHMANIRNWNVLFSKSPPKPPEPWIEFVARLTAAPCQKSAASAVVPAKERHYERKKTRTS